MDDTFVSHLGQLKIGKDLPIVIAGVVNLSPESFYSGSIASSEKEVLEMVKTHVSSGAHMVDIGGLSTRPVSYYGGEKAPREVEFERVKLLLPPILDFLTSYPDIEVSIDTMHSEVAEFALSKNVNIVNDVCGLKRDHQLPQVIADYDASVILMAADKSPGDVYSLPDVLSALDESISLALNAGVSRKKIAVDPGIGGWGGREHFDDLYLLTHLSELLDLKVPLYVGLSRKSTIGRIVDESDPSLLLPGTLSATAFLLIRKEVHAIRTHDVYETVQAIKTIERLLAISER
ncbi:MAG: dihydropteroate synthase [Candidatus Heimdallarchaeota archaeon]|nr:dihydropteroate synthase [Candidatus Heimdallarchaeota archaeon]MCK5049483.1 dihydropteroate synthase [Candidatus Heimdallarchaeota archaeon]